MHQPLRDLLSRGGLPGPGGRRDDDGEACGAAEDDGGAGGHGELHPADPRHPQEARCRRQGAELEVNMHVGAVAHAVVVAVAVAVP